MKAKILGLTGYYCAGKNYIAELFRQKGFAVLDVDKLGHEAIEVEKASIVQTFGSDVLDKVGMVDRRALGKKVFDNPEQLAILESIVHPAANKLTLDWIARNETKPRLINAALLHKSSALEKIDSIVMVRAPLLLRLVRAKKRDGLPWKEIFRRFYSQKDFPKLSEKFADTYCIYNTRQNRRRLEERIDKILLKAGFI